MKKKTIYILFVLVGAGLQLYGELTLNPQRVALVKAQFSTTIVLSKR